MLDRAKRAAHTLWLFLTYVARRFNSDGCVQNAQALTYMSLFAVVPILTVMYSVFSLLPDFQEVGQNVQQWVFSNMLPENEGNISEYLKEFSSSARKLSWIGMVILVITAYLMLTNIEKSFNRIWNTTGHRKGVTGFLTYWAILTLGPLLLLIGGFLSGYLFSLELLVSETPAIGWLALLFRILPFVLSVFAFTLIYVAVPNTRVKFRDALVGGLFATIAIEILKDGFATFIANSSYNSVYGAFATVPVFLLWIFLLWVLVLVGAEIVRALETFNSTVRGYVMPDLVATVMIAWICHQQQKRGREVSDRGINRSGVPDPQWRRLRTLLLKKRLLTKTESGRYVLSRELDQVSLWDLVELFGDNFTSLPQTRFEEQLDSLPWYSQLEQRLQQAQQQVASDYGVTLKQLFSEAEKTV